MRAAVWAELPAYAVANTASEALLWVIEHASLKPEEGAEDEAPASYWRAKALLYRHGRLQRPFVRNCWQAQAGMQRSQTGLTAAGVMFAVAVFAQDQHQSILAIVWFMLTGLVLVGTYAHRLPALHRLPLIGAQRPRSAFTLEGCDGLRLDMVPAKPTGTL